jgi:hypothetical protein
MGTAEIFPRGQQAAATGEEAAEGRKWRRNGHEIYPRREIGPALKVLSLVGPWRRRDMIGYTRWLNSCC